MPPSLEPQYYHMRQMTAQVRRAKLPSSSALTPTSRCRRRWSSRPGRGNFSYRGVWWSSDPLAPPTQTSQLQTACRTVSVSSALVSPPCRSRGKHVREVEPTQIRRHLFPSAVRSRSGRRNNPANSGGNFSTVPPERAAGSTELLRIHVGAGELLGMREL